MESKLLKTDNVLACLSVWSSNIYGDNTTELTEINLGWYWVLGNYSITDCTVCKVEEMKPEVYNTTY